MEYSVNDVDQTLNREQEQIENEEEDAISLHLHLRQQRLQTELEPPFNHPPPSQYQRVDQYHILLGPRHFPREQNQAETSLSLVDISISNSNLQSQLPKISNVSAFV